ncbi:alpha/beta fold hydrolase, partial [Patescibacteria group bacterium]|nr:alpha/beta fold hydrolase [Patescibacteria group bacterium]
LHGYGASSLNFHDIMEELDDKYRVFALDLPGFGLSDKRSESDFSFDGQVQTVVDFIEEKNIDHTYLIGHSMGGAVAAKVAALYPDKIDKLVLIAPTGLGEYKSGIEWISKFPMPIDRLITRWFLINANSMQKVLLDSYYDDDFVTKTLIKEYLAPAQTKGSDYSYVRKIRLGISPDITEVFSQITQPTLLLWGREDQIISSNQMDTLTELIPDNEGYFMEGVGHVPQGENAEGTASLINRFLSKLI